MQTHFAGRWTIEGQTADAHDTACRGSLAMHQEEEIWWGTWHLGSGHLGSESELESGVGLVHGSSLLSSRSPADGKTAGVVIYQRLDDGSLAATWYRDSLPERNRAGTGGACALEKTRGFSGRYEIRYKDSCGKPVGDPLSLSIERLEDSASSAAKSDQPVYQIKWSELTEGGHLPLFTGVGFLLDPSHMGIGWGEPHIESSVVHYRAKGSGELTGRWARCSPEGLGTESLVRVRRPST